MTLTMGEKFNFAKMQAMKRFNMKIMNSIRFYQKYSTLCYTHQTT